MNTTCEQIQEKLVAYADRELSQEESSNVARHVSQCPGCRDLVLALEESLAIVIEAWDRGGSQTPERSQAIRGLKPKPYRTLIKAMAAVVLLALGLWLAIAEHGSPPAQTPSLAQIQAHIETEAKASMLLSAAQMLENLEGYQGLTARQYRQVIDIFPETSAAATAKTRINEL